MKNFFSSAPSRSLPVRQAGFSLLELLVVTAISLVILGGAIAAFTTFADRRSVSNTVGELKIYLQRAQSRARSGDLAGCDQLAGYQVQTYLSGTNQTQLSLQAVCSSGTATAATTYDLPSGVTVSPNLNVTFDVLNGGAQLDGGAASQDITVTGGSYVYQFTLYREGRMSEGVWQ
jgi:prepilin-type N-terminal cleavage/methylation domain-containing protein